MEKVYLKNGNSTMKRIHLKNQPPEIHGMIAEHMASHGHKSMEDTVTCLIKEAMKRFDKVDKIEDLTKLVNRYITENEKLKAENWELKKKDTPAKTFDEAFERYGI
jgi:hypothetical protein